MDLFQHCAEEILEIAGMGGSERLTVLVQDNGPGLRPGLHLIMGEGQACLPPRGAETAAFRVTRSSGAGGAFVRVRGAQAGRVCDLQAEALALPVPPPFLINNQALYEVAGGGARAV